MLRSLTKEQISVFVLLCLGNLSISFNTAAVAAVVSSIGQSMGVSDLEVARLIPIYLIPYGLMALVYVHVTRKITYRWVYILTMALFAWSNYICFSSESINQLFFGRLIMGMTASSSTPLGLMVIGDAFKKDMRGRLVGMFFSCSFLGALAGIVVSGAAPWQWLFGVPTFLGIATVLAFFANRSLLIRQCHQAPIHYASIIHRADIRNVFLFIFIISMLYHGVHKWFGIFLSRDYHLEQWLISLFFILLTLGGFFGQIAGGILSDKKDRSTACRWGLCILSVTTIGLYVHSPLIVLGVLFIAMSVGWTICHNGISTILTDFSDEDRPLIAGLNSAVRFLSGGLGFIISGYFVHYGFNIVFCVIGVLMLLLTLAVQRKMLPF